MSLAANYARNAASYVRAGERLAGEDSLPADLYPAFYFLIAFALELSLKALALAAGHSEDEVRGWGHDLRKALHSSVHIGTVSLMGTQLDVVVLMLSDYHRDLALRYTPADLHVMQVPPVMIALEESKALASKAWDAAEVARAAAA